MSRCALTSVRIFWIFGEQASFATPPSGHEALTLAITVVSIISFRPKRYRASLHNERLRWMVTSQEATQLEDDRIVPSPAPSGDTAASRWKRWRRWRSLPFQAQFEHAIVLILSGLIALVVVLSVWSLALKVLAIVLHPDSFDATD